MSDVVSFARGVAKRHHPLHASIVQLLAGCVIIGVSAWAIDPQVLQTLAAILILGLFAMSFGLLLGHAGLPLIGHAAFFGIGAYASGIAALHVSSSILVTAPLGIGAATLAAWLFSLVALRTQALQLMLVSLAFGGLLKAALEVIPDWTGGNDGLPGIPAARLDVPGSALPVLITSPVALFSLTAIVTLLAYIAMRELRLSPLGRLVVGIRDNAVRVTALGVQTTRPLRRWVTLCGSLAGLSGVLHTYVYHFLSPTILGLEASLDGLVMVVVGGMGNLAGSVLGAAVIFVVKEKLPAFTSHWPSILGLFYIVFALGAQRTLTGLFVRWRAPPDLAIDRATPKHDASGVTS